MKVLKVYKPTTPSRRKTSVLVDKSFNKVSPKKSLLVIRKKKSGRNSQGKITVRHQGGGAKRFIRQIDFLGNKFDLPGTIKTLEYDPNRNTKIALVVYPDGDQRYILAPEGLKIDDQVLSSQKNIAIKIGHRLPLSHIPTGTAVYNVEIRPNKGGQLARSAGNSIIFMALSDGKAQLKMPSGEIRIVDEKCLASIGTLSNAEYRNIRIGKAGRKRHMGIRPSVRGKAMNPVDHPHGGGEGGSPIGMKNPKTYTGKIAFGVKTRKNNKYSDKFIIKRR